MRGLPLMIYFSHPSFHSPVASPQLSASCFVKPKKLVLYIRGSRVTGQFGNSYEYAVA
jgi:hypothetical protein